MLLFVPYGINALHQRRPVANWVIIAVTVVVSTLAYFSGTADEFGAPYGQMVLFGWEPNGMFGHMFLHSGVTHLVGNMIFLWVFGNALCANMNSILYVVIYLLVGLLAASVHLFFDGSPAIGASGAINGVIGLALAIYPRDDVDVFYLFIVKGGTFEMPVWGLALIWLAFDIFGAASGAGGVAYYAHIGGLVAGILTGLVLLQFEKIDLTVYDRETLLELLKGEKVD